ncbi:hypothetical protein WDV93_17240 [Pantoea ananatis]
MIQNHLVNVLLLLAMEPPSSGASDDLVDEKVQVLKAMPPLSDDDVVRGQFEGYIDEPGVAASSPTETFAAVRFQITTWRWSGVPFYIRAGKNLPAYATEVVVRFRRPPVTLSMKLPTVPRQLYPLSPRPGYYDRHWRRDARRPAKEMRVKRSNSPRWTMVWAIWRPTSG